MPLETQLIRDGRIFVYTYSEPFEMAEVEEMVNRIHHEVLDKAEKPVYFISDLTRIDQLPPNILTRARAINRHRHRMAGRSFIVVKPGLISAIARSLLKVIGTENFLISYSVEDAMGIIEQLLAQEAPNASNPIA